MTLNVFGASKPIVSEDKVDINDRFYAHYTTYVNGASFFRPNNAWYKFTKRNHIDSNTNPTISIPINDGVKTECFEHVSVCIGGSSEFIMTRHDYTYDDNGNLVSDVVGEKAYAPWTFGDNNVENGLGHLPTEQFTRTFDNDYETCCILPILETDLSEIYNFEVIKLNNSSHILNRNIKFAHIAFGNVSINGSNYAQKQNVMDLINGTTISSTENSIVILGYIVE